MLLPAVRRASADTLVIADGFSCRTQIAQATPRRALHLADILEMVEREDPAGPSGDFPERRYVPDYGRQTIGPAMAVAAGAALLGYSLLRRDL